MKGKITEEDEHKPVFDQEGERVGTVAKVEDGTLYVDFEPKIRDVLKRSLGFDEVDEEHTQPLDNEMIDMVNEDLIRLREAN
jgi:hypothetical protein